MPTQICQTESRQTQILNKDQEDVKYGNTSWKHGGINSPQKCIVLKYSLQQQEQMKNQDIIFCSKNLD